MLSNIQVTCTVAAYGPSYSKTQALKVVIYEKLVLQTIEPMTVKAGDNIVFRPEVTSSHQYENLVFAINQVVAEADVATTSKSLDA